MKRLRNGAFLGIVVCLVTLVSSGFSQRVVGADEYDGLRTKWKTMLIGAGYDTANPDYNAIITRITAKAQTNWDSLNKAPNRTYLWSDLQGTSDASYVTEAYTRLKAMALAYSTNGSELYNNATLLADMSSALDWLYGHWYNTSPPAFTFNSWWYWEIGTPLQLNDIMVLLYDNLTPTQISNYAAVID